MMNDECRMKEFFLFYFFERAERADFAIVAEGYKG